MTNREAFIKFFDNPTFEDPKCYGKSSCRDKPPCASCTWWDNQCYKPIDKSNLLKIFISQPMRGKTKEEIIQEREKIENRWRGKRAIFINSYFGAGASKNPMDSLGKSISLMGEADIVAMAPGWTEARGCRVEYEAALAYGKTIIDYSESAPRVIS